MLLMILLQMYLQLRSKAPNMNLAHHYTYQILQDSNRSYRPMDWIHWLSTIPTVGPLPFPSKPVQLQCTLSACTFTPFQITNSSRNEYASREKPSVYEGMEDDPVFVVFIVLKEVCSTSQQSSSSKQTLEKIQGTYEFSCQMSLERWNAVFISWSA